MFSFKVLLCCFAVDANYGSGAPALETFFLFLVFVGFEVGNLYCSTAIHRSGMDYWGGEWRIKGGF